MAYQNPEFIFDSVVRDHGGFSQESGTSGGSSSPSSLGLLSDDFAGAIYTSNAVFIQEDDYILFRWTQDFSSTSSEDYPDCLVIPPGSNLYADGSTKVGVQVRLANSVQSAEVLIDQTEGPIFIPLEGWSSSSATTSQVLFFQRGGNRKVGTIKLGEITIGKRVSLDRGPAPGWRHSVLSNLDRLQTKSGISSQWLNGRPRRTWQFTYERLSDSDMEKFSGLYRHAGGGAFVFYFLPPDDSLSWTPVLLSQDAEITADSDAPMAFSSNGVSLNIIEALG